MKTCLVPVCLCSWSLICMWYKKKRFLDCTLNTNVLLNSIVKSHSGYCHHCVCFYLLNIRIQPYWKSNVRFIGLKLHKRHATGTLLIDFGLNLYWWWWKWVSLLGKRFFLVKALMLIFPLFSFCCLSLAYEACTLRMASHAGLLCIKLNFVGFPFFFSTIQLQ